jgi:hypothetical protein
MKTDVVECQVDFPCDMLANRPRYADPAWFGEPLDARGHVHVIAVNAASVVNDLTEVDANSEFQSRVFSQFGIALRHLPLKLDGGPDRCDGTQKLDENGISRLIDYPTAMAGCDTVEQVEASLEFSQCFLVIHLGEATEPGNVSVEDGGKLALHGVLHQM